MSSVTLQEAQARLPQLLEQLQPGQEITITDQGQPLAQVKKAEPMAKRKPRQAGLAKGILTILQDDDEHLKDFAEYMP